MSLGTRVRTIREEQGLSLSGLARAAGISKGYLCNFERHDHEIGASLLYRIAGALGTTMENLMDGCGQPVRRRWVTNAAVRVWTRGGAHFRQIRLDVISLESAIESAREALTQIWAEAKPE